MLKAWDKWDTFDEEKSSMYTWLSTIARNTSIDTVRLKGYKVSQKTDSFDNLVHDKDSTSINTATIDIKKIMTALDPKYSIILQKMYMEGNSQREVAELLDIPLGTVKTRLRKAMQILRDELKNEKHLFLGFLFFLITLITVLWI